MLAGKAAESSAELNAFNIETQMVNAEAETQEKMNARLYEYRSNLSTNVAALFTTGRDVDPYAPSKTSSVGAFLKENKNIAGKDVKAAAHLGQQKSLASQMAMSAELARGRAAATSGFITGLSTMTKGIQRYNDIKVGAVPNAPYTSVASNVRT